MAIAVQRQVRKAEKARKRKRRDKKRAAERQVALSHRRKAPLTPGTAQTTGPYWVLESDGLTTRPTTDVGNLPTPTSTTGRWVAADDLQLGDVIAGCNARRLVVTALATNAQPPKFQFAADLLCWVIEGPELDARPIIANAPTAKTGMERGRWVARRNLRVGDLIDGDEKFGYVVTALPTDPDLSPTLRRLQKCRVEKTFSNGRKALLRVYYANEMVRVTQNHPWYVKDRGWTASSDLRSGDLLMTVAGGFVPVERIEDIGEVEEVFNLCVSDCHTYFIGVQSEGPAVLVHNQSPVIDQQTLDAANARTRALQSAYIEAMRHALKNHYLEQIKNADDIGDIQDAIFHMQQAGLIDPNGYKTKASWDALARSLTPLSDFEKDMIRFGDVMTGVGRGVGQAFKATAIATVIVGVSVFSVPIALTATGSLLIYGLSTAALDRIAKNQTKTQVFLGAIADVTGPANAFAAWTNRDIATGEDLHLSDQERGRIGFLGFVETASLVFGTVKTADNVLKAADNLHLIREGTETLGKTSKKYDAFNPGPLADNHAGTFSGGKYTEVTLDADLILHRAGAKDVPLGEYFDIIPPKSVIQARIDKAILPEWPGGKKSVIDTSFEILIPKGTKVYVGQVSTQNSFYVGGTRQFVVPQPWKIEGVKVLSSTPLH